MLLLSFAAPRMWCQGERSFSYDQPNPHTVPLPGGIRTLLEHDPIVIDRLAEGTPRLTELPTDWVLCYRVTLGPPRETDYLVQANPPLGGANVTSFWVFRMVAGVPKQVLFTGGLSVEIGGPRSNGLQEIRTFSVTKQRLNAEVYRFNGARYSRSAEHIHRL